jgi:hypothetical protein
MLIAKGLFYKVVYLMTLRGDLSSNFTRWSTFARFRVRKMAVFRRPCAAGHREMIVRRKGEIICKMGEENLRVGERSGGWG